MRHLCLALTLLATACVDQRYFAPRENENGTGPGGHPAAVYPLRATDAVGELRLWSRGSRGFTDEGTDNHTVELHVGFELENTGATALELGEVSCSELWIGKSLRTAVLPTRTEGGMVAQPDATARVDAWFRLDDVESARDVDAFSVRFAVLRDGVPILVQVTPFAMFIPPNPRDRDPWFFGPYGYGYGYGGFGWRCH